MFLSNLYGYLISGTKIVTGSTALINDVTKVLTGFSAAATTLVVIILFFQKSHAEDDGEAKIIKKRIKQALTYGIGTTLVAALVTAITGYYK